MNTVPKKIRATYRQGVLEPNEPLVLPEGEEVMVIIEPAPDLSERENARRFQAAAGSWKAVVDERLLEDIYALRRLKTRPEIEPWQ